ncbi:MAG: DUF1150 family protein [Geminicoccaceae bacterium]|nr:DUF1150 family protein [Geminicoccaceae bacterium]
MPRHPAMSPSTENPALPVPPIVAYIRPVEEEGQACYAICSEDGEPLGLSPTRALAIAAIRQYDMVPMDAH